MARYELKDFKGETMEPHLPNRSRGLFLPRSSVSKLFGLGSGLNKLDHHPNRVG